MTVPGVNVTVAATFMATVGDIRRFQDRRKLVAYLGLDPKVRQSGDAPANHGHISRARIEQRAPRARRSVLVDRPPARPDRRVLPAHQGAARTLDRHRRRSPQARLPVLVSAHARRGLRLRPAVADQEEDASPRDHRRRRALARCAATSGAPTRRCARPNASSHCKPSAPTNAPSTTGRPRSWVRARHRGAHLKGRLAAKQRGRPQSPSDLRFSSVSHPHPNRTLPQEPAPIQTT